MHLRSISMKGFKSFPHRTKLEFGTGVSVVVGPNGSGKSNITDAVLWALGEQSPLAVRGQVMKDVIFAGGHGVQGASAAEVEVVIDNSDRGLDSDFSELSIVRRLDRDGEGEMEIPFSTTNWGQTDFTQHSVPLDEFISGGPPKDGIPSIDEPRFESIEQATEGEGADASIVGLGRMDDKVVIILDIHSIIKHVLL
jgi:energy-coupling factor transporter ATP-binding protein EcfA2